MVLLPHIGALLALSLPQLPDAGAVLQSIHQSQAEGRSHLKPGEKANFSALNAEIKKKSSDAVSGVDVSKIPVEQAADWSELFQLAGREDDAAKLSEESIGYLSMKAWNEQENLLPYYLKKGDKSKILETLDFAQGINIRMLGQLGEFVTYGVAPKYGDSDPSFVLHAYDLLIRRVEKTRPMSADDKKWELFAEARLGANKDALLYRLGKHSTALADLKRIKMDVAQNSFAVAAVDEVANQLSITGKPAPEIVASQTIGSYAGLGALKGKVVLVDFFAHWCGPCKRAFPALEDLYSVQQANGLSIVGVTSLQGYYADQKNVKPQAEFLLMKNQFVPQNRLPWPVIFEKNKSATTAYGVSVIPHLVIIDRKGLVRRIVVGYSADEFKQTKAFIQKLLAEPA